MLFLGLLSTLATVTAQQGAPLHYRVTLNASRSIDRNAGDEARAGAYTAVAYLTSTTTSEAGERRGHVVIDSVRCSGTGLMSMAFDSIVGIRSRGTRYDFPIGTHFLTLPAPSIQNTLTNVLGQAALMLFSALVADVRPGATWSDSLDTTPTDLSEHVRPILTRWKVARLAGDSTLLEGDLSGVLPLPSRMVGSGVVTGVRRATIVSGTVRSQTLTTSQQVLVVPEGATTITVGTANTSFLIVAIDPARPMP